MFSGDNESGWSGPGCINSTPTHRPSGSSMSNTCFQQSFGKITASLVRGAHDDMMESGRNNVSRYFSGVPRPGVVAKEVTGAMHRPEIRRAVNAIDSRILKAATTIIRHHCTVGLRRRWYCRSEQSLLMNVVGLVFQVKLPEG
mmetsp:Transcript_14036/g.23809  ORF Transcript_14036/g.23809 Transcript_14036/m.23809 type:complete len:143 (-) Transcript_14036:63-491(-)